MSSKSASYRQILRSSSIIGGASALNIVFGLVRMKAVALILGPAGVGLIGLLGNCTSVAGSIAGLGIGSAGTRQIAEAAGREDAVDITSARRALFWASIGLALAGTLLFWLLRDAVASRVLHNAVSGDELGWLALSVGLSVAAASQSALLNGLRRIGDLSRVSVYSAAASSVFGVAVLWIWGRNGLLAYLLIGPLFSFLIGHWYVSKLPKPISVGTSFRLLSSQWSMLFKLGVAFMMSNLVRTSGQLTVSSLVQREMGLEVLGYFQAASVLSMTYIGFVLSAMATDYYPRLTATINDHVQTNRIVNEQTEVALLLAGPLFLGMLAVAPWLLTLLYSEQFRPAADILHWQIIGDIMKVASWPLAFIILAAGDGKAYIGTESIGIVAFVLLTWIGLPLLGLQATGIAYLGLYVVYLPLVYWLAKRRTGFTWRPVIRKQLFVLLSFSLLVLFLAKISLVSAAILGVLFSGAYALYGFGRLAHKTELTGGLGKLASAAQNIMKKVGVWHE